LTEGLYVAQTGLQVWMLLPQPQQGLQALATCTQFIYFVCVCVVLGLELRAYTLSHSTTLFCDGFFKIGSPRLFPQAGF
jgi:hypothetical protein